MAAAGCFAPKQTRQISSTLQHHEHQQTLTTSVDSCNILVNADLSPRFRGELTFHAGSPQRPPVQEIR